MLRRVHEDLELRARRREDRDLRWVELERQVRPWRAGFVDDEVVGPQHRVDDRQEAAQDPVLVQALDRVDRLPDLDPQSLCLVVVAGIGIEPRAEQLDEQRRDVGVAEQRALHVRVRERDSGLAQVLGDRAHDGDLAARQSGAEHQPVERVVLELAPPRGEERVLEDVADPFDVLGRAPQPEVVQPCARTVDRSDLVRALVDDLRPHVLERRHDV